MDARADPPVDEADLLARAASLRGKTLGTIASSLGLVFEGAGVRTKGKGGDLVERALGATGGSAKVHDFPSLRIELKTIPVDARNKPHESTYVCTLPMDDVDQVEWETSWARSKLQRVLWVPVVAPHDAKQSDRVIGTPLLWSPTHKQEAVLRSDFDDVMGMIALGHVEALTAHTGRWLQVRPKARDGSARTVAWGRDGERIPTTPRGFYLRPSFTGALLEDPRAVP